MEAVWLGGTPPKPPVHVVIEYWHPLDECRNGGMRWRVIFGEIAPGLFDIRHPKCSRCFAEPMIEKNEIREGPAPWRSGDTVPWGETKQKLVTVRGKREPHRETEPIYDDGRFDNA